MPRRIAISSGHGLYVRGARGNPVPPELDERDENVKVVDRVFELLQGAHATVAKFHDDTSRSQSENLNRIVSWHNGQTRDLDVSVHFNAGGSDLLMGTEVLYVTQQALAGVISGAIASNASWPNRGAKYRSDLAFLNGTNKPAVLIETCFCDSTADGNRYRERFEDICLAIAESIADVAIEPGPEPPEPEPESAQVEIKVTGNVTVIVNGEVVYGEEPEPETPSYQKDIIATEFYGTGAPGAYGIPIPGSSSSAKYLALPWKDQALKNKKVRVTNSATGQSAVGEVWDLGPWFIDDNYPALKARPLAETCYKEGAPCPRGPNAGKVPNGAGIDLSPALAKAIGIDGKGKVDWDWEEV